MKSKLRTFFSQLKASINEQLESTTVQAVPKILRSKEIFSQIGWLLYLGVSFALCAFFLIKNAQDYLKYQVITNINLVESKNQPFPKVTICYMAMPIDLTSIDLVEFRFSQLSKSKLRQSNDHCIEVNSGFNQSGHRDEIVTIAGAEYFGGFKIVTKNPNISNTFDVYISNQSERIDPYKAIKISSSMDLVLDISIEHKDRLAEPYSNCKKDVTVENRKLPYFEHNCIVHCKYKEISSRCNKTAEFQAIENSFYSDSVSFDARYNNFTASCLRTTSIEDEVNRSPVLREFCRSSCPEECYSVKYSVKTFMNNVASFGKYSRVFINNRDYKYSLITQFPKIAWDDFFGIAGGHLSLFLGISLLSFIEVFEFMDILVNLIKLS